MIRLGFTGTRQGLTSCQRAALGSVFAVPPDQLLHGGAIGADSEFHIWFRQRVPGVNSSVEIFPACAERYVYWRNKYDDDSRVVIHPFMAPLIRNRLIAGRCHCLLACPDEPAERLRSGTWSTVRYARKAGKPIVILLPDGTVRREFAS